MMDCFSGGMEGDDSTWDDTDSMEEDSNFDQSNVDLQINRSIFAIEEEKDSYSHLDIQVNILI